MLTTFVQEFGMRKTALLSLFILSALPLHADDGAASISAGGIILMKREPRIVMAKEVLNISDSKVVVDYDFRNDSNEDVSTEVAFPVPPYTLNWDERNTKDASFDDFKLWIDDQPLKFTIQLRAFAGKRDITALLQHMHVDAATFGHFDSSGRDSDPHSPDIEHLLQSQRRQLIAAGAFQSEKDMEPRWRVEKKYHWTQTFPAHGVVHIRHEYTPVLGNSNTIGDPKDFHDRPADEEYASVCPDLALQNTLAKIWNRPRGIGDVSPLWIRYVDFILTTANTWKTPIEDFTLNVERPHDPKYVSYVSFCWDGPVTKIDADHFTAHVNGLIPKKELRIGYIMGDAKLSSDH